MCGRITPCSSTTRNAMPGNCRSRSASTSPTVVSLHSSKYIPEAAPSIKTGILTMTSAVMDLLNN
jgi:hypothetical protein